MHFYNHSVFLWFIYIKAQFLHLDTVNCYEEFKNEEEKVVYTHLYMFLGQSRVEFEIACSNLRKFHEHVA